DTQVGGEVRGPREQVVTDQDRDRVGPARVGARRAAAYLSLVHHIVVVQGGEVGQLHGGRGRYQVGGAGITEVTTQGHQQRAEPLAAGDHQVLRRFRDQRVRAGHPVAQEPFGLLQHALYRRRQARVSDVVHTSTLTEEGGGCARQVQNRAWRHPEQQG